jgi:hypothetical protein
MLGLEMKYFYHFVHSSFFRTGDLVFIELLDTRTDANNIVVNAVVRKLVIPDEELKPVLPKVKLPEI